MVWVVKKKHAYSELSLNYSLSFFNLRVKMQSYFWQLSLQPSLATSLVKTVQKVSSFQTCFWKQKVSVGIFFRKFWKQKQIRSFFSRKRNEYGRATICQKLESFINFPETNSDFFFSESATNYFHIHLISFSLFYSKCLDLYWGLRWLVKCRFFSSPVL